MAYGSQTNNAGEALGEDMKNTAKDAGDAIRASGQQMSEQMGERYRTARGKFQDTLGQAKSGLSDMQQNVSARTRDTMDATDQYVREHPWQSVGIGAAIGLVVGFLMMRR